MTANAEKIKEFKALTFPGATYEYMRTSMTLESCKSTLPTALRPAFKSKIETIIEKMHALGFAFGVLESALAGYRTFEQQVSIPSSQTKAGPGESFHNYGLAVDLGCLDWVDAKGKRHKGDFWLEGMESGFARKVWAKRDFFAPSGVYTLNWEIIHMQGVKASESGRAALVRCLNAVADGTWRYRNVSGGYESTLGTDATWTRIGTAKQMWSNLATNCTAAQRAQIKTHMAKAEAVARTIPLS